MNKRIIKLGLDSGMLNYVDHETPRHYFLCGYADEECLEKFAELIVRECADLRTEIELVGLHSDDYEQGVWEGIRMYQNQIKRHFNIK